MKNKNIIDKVNDPDLEFNFYEHCIYKKQNYVQLCSSSQNSLGLFDLIHYDVVGVIKYPLLSMDLF